MMAGNFQEDVAFTFDSSTSFLRPSCRGKRESVCREVVAALAPKWGPNGLTVPHPVPWDKSDQLNPPLNMMPLAWWVKLPGDVLIFNVKTVGLRTEWKD